jgi:hypothetical protein
MARIRSIHPGLASDESYMSMSMAAKAAWPLLWTECDDQGVFEWKPIVLKARIFPADNIDFSALLDELRALDCVKSFDLNGKKFGLVRNFRRFQRPKKPNNTHLLPSEFRIYVGLSGPSSELDDDQDDDSSPPVPHQFPTSGEKSPQMEDVGCRMKDEGREEEVPIGTRTSDQPNASDPEQEAVDAWNELAKATGLSKVQKFDTSRRKKVRLRLDDCGGIEAWSDMIAGIRDSPHLLGMTPSKNGQTPWKASFDWLIEPRNFTKVMEGNYIRIEGHAKPDHNNRRKSSIELVHEALAGRDGEG